MYCGINKDNLTRFGINTEETKQRIIDVIIKEFKESNDLEKEDEVSTLINVLATELNKWDVYGLLHYSNDANDIIINAYEETILAPLKTESIKFKQMIESNPQLNDDEYWDEVNGVYNLIADMVSGEENSQLYYPQTKITPFMYLYVSFNDIRANIKANFLNFF